MSHYVQVLVVLYCLPVSIHRVTDWRRSETVFVFVFQSSTRMTASWGRSRLDRRALKKDRAERYMRFTSLSRFSWFVVTCNMTLHDMLHVTFLLIAVQQSPAQTHFIPLWWFCGSESLAWFYGIFRDSCRRTRVYWNFSERSQSPPSSSHISVMMTS